MPRRRGERRAGIEAQEVGEAGTGSGSGPEDEVDGADTDAVFIVQGCRFPRNQLNTVDEGTVERTDLFRRIQRWFETADFLATPTLSRTALPVSYTHLRAHETELDLE